MFGLSAQYQFTEAVKSVFYVINRFNFLAAPNHLPGYGTQVSCATSSRITLTQNFYYGPDQSNTDLRYWRFFSDSSIQWKKDNLNLALVYAKAGRRGEAAAAARDLLARLPANAPQRPEIERLLRAVQ